MMMLTLGKLTASVVILAPLSLAAPTNLPACEDNSQTDCVCEDGGCSGFKFDGDFAVYCDEWSCRRAQFGGQVDATCHGQHSCHNAVFTGDVVATCINDDDDDSNSACKAASFRGNVVTTCNGRLACKAAKFYDNTDTTCGGDLKASQSAPECRSTFFNDEARVLCKGKYSCKHASFNDQSGATCSAKDTDRDDGSCSFGHKDHKEDAQYYGETGYHNHKKLRTGYCEAGHYGYPKEGEGCQSCPNGDTVAVHRGVGPEAYRCESPLTGALTAGALEDWMIAVIVLAALLAVALVAGLVICLRKRSKQPEDD